MHKLVPERVCVEHVEREAQRHGGTVGLTLGGAFAAACPGQRGRAGVHADIPDVPGPFAPVRHGLRFAAFMACGAVGAYTGACTIFPQIERVSLNPA